MKKQKIAVVLFFIVLFLSGLFVSGDYGIPYDEKQEQAILNANTREVMIRLGMEDRIPPYTDKNESEYRISESLEKDHGIACYYPIAGYVLYRDSRPTKELSFVWQTYTYCLNFLGVLAVYGTVRRLTGRRLPAGAAALILFVCPRMFAEMHYNNKDMVCLMLTMVVLYFGVRWILDEKRRYAVGFGIASAFAVNARLVSVVVFGLVGLAYLLLLWHRNRNAAEEAEKAAVRNDWKNGWLAIGVCAVTYVAITPAMWGDPVRFAGYLIRYTFDFSRWNNPILFAGGIFQKGTEMPLPRWYLPVQIVLTTPLWVWIPVVSGLVVAWHRLVKTGLSGRREVAACMVSVAWLFPVLLAVALQMHVYNGWRQFYFVFGPAVVMAGLGIDAFSERFRKRRAVYSAGTAALAGCVLFTAWGTVKNHPYQFGYVNMLAGDNAENEYELDYWHVSAGPLIGKLAEQTGAGETVTISALVPQDIHGVYYAKRLLPEERKEAIAITENDPAADYVFVNLSYRYRIPAEKLAALEEGFHVHSTAEAYGNTLSVLYEKNK
ncbi:MAG: glycosyltransferase family 39 protein [Clostridia bacterium]|nr:glycosyltransferase family 39 protein [Clostridia bacterium]